MMATHVVRAVLLTAFVTTVSVTDARAQQQQPFEPSVGQAGKDVVWVPTPEELVEKMLDMAKVTPADYVMDLGSGDGRNIIGAAKRGATAVGVEFNPDMVELSRRKAQEAGVSAKAQFIQGDMYEADISKASVMALFLLPQNLEKLRDKFLALKPGTRIVLNTFAIPEWEPDETVRITGNCSSWCTSLLNIVPAKAAGVWKFSGGEVEIVQAYQKVTGTVRGSGAATALEGKLVGEQITFTAGGTEYTGKVDGNRITGSRGMETWTATRATP
jgi:SAM-dependent methyltransferase